MIMRLWNALCNEHKSFLTIQITLKIVSTLLKEKQPQKQSISKQFEKAKTKQKIVNSVKKR